MRSYTGVEPFMRTKVLDIAGLPLSALNQGKTSELFGLLLIFMSSTADLKWQKTNIMNL
jgi:hypothetical protein